MLSLKQKRSIHAEFDLSMTYMDEFDREWTKTVQRIKSSGYDLSTIPILPKSVEYRKGKNESVI